MTPTSTDQSRAVADVEPVAWLENLTDPQPHAVTDLKYCSIAQHERGDHLKYTPVVPASALAALQAENQGLRDMYGRLKKMIDDGSINERMYSAGIEQEGELQSLRTQLAESQAEVERLKSAALAARGALLFLGHSTASEVVQAIDAALQGGKT